MVDFLGVPSDVLAALVAGASAIFVAYIGIGGYRANAREQRKLETWRYKSQVYFQMTDSMLAYFVNLTHLMSYTLPPDKLFEDPAEDAVVRAQMHLSFARRDEKAVGEEFVKGRMDEYDRMFKQVHTDEEQKEVGAQWAAITMLALLIFRVRTMQHYILEFERARAQVEVLSQDDGLLTALRDAANAMTKSQFEFAARPPKEFTHEELFDRGIEFEKAMVEVRKAMWEDLPESDTEFEVDEA